MTAEGELRARLLGHRHWLGVLLLARQGLAFFGLAPTTGPVPSAVGVLAGVGIVLAGGRGLLLPIDEPDRPTPTFWVVLLLFAFQAATVLAGLTGGS